MQLDHCGDWSDIRVLLGCSLIQRKHVDAGQDIPVSILNTEVTDIVTDQPPVRPYPVETSWVWQVDNAYTHLVNLRKVAYGAWVDLSSMFSWGDQPAALFVQVLDGIIRDAVVGVGTNTPIPTANPGEFTTYKESEEKHLRAAMARGKSSIWETVALHLRTSFELEHNPLPTFRKKYPGMWKYCHDFPPAEADEVRFEGPGWVVIYRKASS